VQFEIDFVGVSEAARAINAASTPASASSSGRPAKRRAGWAFTGHPSLLEGAELPKSSAARDAGVVHQGREEARIQRRRGRREETRTGSRQLHVNGAWTSASSMRRALSSSARRSDASV
jgi:hypothetical protein